MNANPPLGLEVTSSSCCSSGDKRPDDVRHPLDPLTDEEIRKVVEIVRNDPQFGLDFLFETVELLEPEKSLVRQYRPGDPIKRVARINLFKIKQDGIWRLTASLAERKVLTSMHQPTAKPMIQLEQFTAIEDAVRAAPEFITACKKRGIDDTSLVCIDPWSAGNFGVPGEDGRYLAHVFAWVRLRENDNLYAHPSNPKASRSGSLGVGSTGIAGRFQLPRGPDLA
jgi:primary-amine oxidase